MVRSCHTSDQTSSPHQNISDGRHIVWRRGFNVLATGHTVIVADSRVSIEKHKGVNSLVIKDISELDAGDYVCQVILSPGL